MIRSPEINILGNDRKQERVVARGRDCRSDELFRVIEPSLGKEDLRSIRGPGWIQRNAIVVGNLALVTATPIHKPKILNATNRPGKDDRLSLISPYAGARYEISTMLPIDCQQIKLAILEDGLEGQLTYFVNGEPSRWTKDSIQLRGLARIGIFRSVKSAAAPAIVACARMMLCGCVEA